MSPPEDLTLVKATGIVPFVIVDQLGTREGSPERRLREGQVRLGILEIGPLEVRVRAAERE